MGATCEETKLSAEQALEAFGQHFVLFVLRSGNARFLKAGRADGSGEGLGSVKGDAILSKDIEQ